MARHITLWTKMFLAPRQGDRLFVYSPDPPRGGIVLVVALQFVWLGAMPDFDEGFGLPLPVSARSPPACGLAG